MSVDTDLSKFLRKMDAISKVYSSLPTEIATVAVNFSKERFREQSWLDSTKENWEKRKVARKGKKKSQTLLVDTGRLKRSIRKIYADERKIIIGTDVPYAQIQNDGGTINKNVTVRAHAVRAHSVKSYSRTRKGRNETVKMHTVKTHTVNSHSRHMNTKIPSRRFIGNSYTLNKRINLLIMARFAKALKQP